MKTKASKTLEQIKEYLELQGLYSQDQYLGDLFLFFEFTVLESSIITYHLEIKDAKTGMWTLHELSFINPDKICLAQMTSEQLLRGEGFKYIQYRAFEYEKERDQYTDEEPNLIIDIDAKL